MGNTIKWYEGKNGLPQGCIIIRTEVFVVEQGFKDEFDEQDKSALHILIFQDENPIATGRIFSDDGGKIYHIGRVAVTKQFRGTGIGSDLITAMEDKIRTMGGCKSVLSAQVRAKNFYEKLGYISQGEEYKEEYCPHILMNKKL